MSLPDDLQSFAADFLEPLVADGLLDLPEETPLSAAIHAYGVQRHFAGARPETETILRAAIRKAVGQGPRARTQDERQGVWSRALERAGGLSMSEVLSIQGWLAKEAEAQGVPFPRDIPVEALLMAQGMSLDSLAAGPLLAWIRDEAAAVLSEKTRPTPAPAVVSAAPAAAAPAAPPVVEPPPTVDVVEGGLSDSDWDAVVRSVKGRARLKNAERIIEWLGKGGTPAMLFDSERDTQTDRVLAVKEFNDAAPLWFVGDLHGDLLAFEAALHYIRKASGRQDPRFVFLGDLIDDIEYSEDVILGVFGLVMEESGAVCILAGNHDDGLLEKDGTFTSAVQPSEYADELNRSPERSMERQVGRLFRGFLETAPRALFLPDGLFAAHGGFPLKDLWDGIKTPGDLNGSRCLQDYVWTRASESARMKIPNRSSKGCQFGSQDFEGFCDVASSVLKRPVARMVRAHDHVENRFLLYSRYRRNPMLAINTLSRRLNREMFGGFVRKPCVARWVSGRLPEVHRIAVPEPVLRSVYEEPTAATEG